MVQSHELSHYGQGQDYKVFGPAIPNHELPNDTIGLPEVVSTEIFHITDVAPEWRPQIFLPPEYNDLPSIGPEEREQAEDTLRSKIAIRMRKAGLSPSIVTQVDATYDTETPELLVPRQVDIALENGRYRMEARMSIEIDYVDRDNRKWDARVFFFPNRLQKDGGDFPLPSLMRDLGWQVLVKNSKEAIENGETPADEEEEGFINVRLDSICLTGMIDGHVESAGSGEIGCDCEDQRKKIIEEVYKNGGLSLLSMYADGRFNGSAVHAAQIEEQNFRAENGMRQIDTLEAHRNQGVESDSRDPYYAFDFLLISGAWKVTKMRLGTNNDKKLIAAQEQIREIKRVGVHGSDPRYNGGINKQAKIAAGHMAT